MLRQETRSSWIDHVHEGRAAFQRSVFDVSWGIVQTSAVDWDLTGYYPSPNGKSVISPADREWVGLGGLAVVEASWARLDEVPFSKIRSPHERLCEC